MISLNPSSTLKFKKRKKKVEEEEVEGKTMKR